MATSRSRPKAPPGPSFTSGLCETHGHRLYWEAHGQADRPAVVLLHHGLGSTHTWRAHLPVLAGAGWRAIAYDRWGYGASDPRPALDLPAFRVDVADLLALLDALRAPRAALVGHSDGGTIALCLAALHPERVAALVVVAAHIYVEAAALPGMLSVARSYESDRRFREGLRRMHGEKWESVFRNWYHGWLRPEHLKWDMRPLLYQIACPALVVQGESDEHATARHAQDLAEAIPGAELWLVPGGHHLLPQEQPEPFNRRLLTFLEPIRASLEAE